MKTYRITANCNPYHARLHYDDQRVLKRDGATPVKWVIEDGLTESEALQRLWEFAREDALPARMTREYLLSSSLFHSRLTPPGIDR